jgi:rRNA maturation endonuclease Nob1
MTTPTTVELKRFRVVCRPCRKLWAVVVPADVEQLSCPLCGTPTVSGSGMEDLECSPTVH